MHRIVIVGGGVAGVEIASALGRRYGRGRARPEGFRVVLLDKDWSHLWKPMLHTIAAGTSDVSQQQTPYVAQAREAGFQYLPGEMEGLDRDAREVLLAELRGTNGEVIIPARRIGYDTLVIAIGSQANDFGTPGVREHCMEIDSRRQAQAFSRASRSEMVRALAFDSGLSIGIVGGGATGVELAAQLVQMTHLAAGYGAEDLPRRVSITLIESGPRLLAAFPEDISAATLERLRSLGIRVLLDSRVASVDESGFMLANGEQVPAQLRVWAAGVKGPPVLAALDGLRATPSNLLEVRPSLQTMDDPDIYAVGDCASLRPPGAQRALPPTAQVAHQQARHLIDHLPAALERGRPVPDFVYRDLGALVSLGEYDAYGSLGKFGLFTGVTIRGRIAQYSHAWLYRAHQVRLHGFWRGTLLWLVDQINSRVRAPITLD